MQGDGNWRALSLHLTERFFVCQALPSDPGTIFVEIIQKKLALSHHDPIKC